jgi:3-deoxy-D-manno-octulosonic-acid transferase
MYAAGDIAYVGASLVKLGGHNILESCAVGVPVIFGPHMFNFEDIAAMAVEVGAASQIYDVDALIAAVDLYLSQPSLRRAAGRAAIDLVASNHGSLETTVQLMKRSLARTQQSRRLASQQALSRSDP